MCVTIPSFLAGLLGVPHLVLRATILDTDHNSSWSVSNSHSAVCRVNMLTSSSVCKANHKDAQVHVHQGYHTPYPVALKVST